MPSFAWSPNSLLFVAFFILEAGIATILIRWAITSLTPRKKGIWFLLGLIAVSTAVLLAWKTLLPDPRWQEMVSPDEPAMIPWGRRTFSTGFWFASWVLPLMPFYALKLLLDDSQRHAPEPLLRFRIALGYVPFHLMSVGIIFL